MDKLLQFGFQHSGDVDVNNKNLIIRLTNNEYASNVLYAFVLLNEEELSNWQVIYIGHTRKTLKNRMYGYERGNGKAVNNRIHNALIKYHSENKQIKLYTMIDAYSITMHKLKIDLPAGVEYALIEYYSDYNKENKHPPLLNISGNKKYNKTDVSDQMEEDQDYEVPEGDLNTNLGTFDYELRATYWNTTNINIPTRYSDLFGNQGSIAILALKQGNNVFKSFQIPINRNANVNGSPRLYISGKEGKWFQDWKHKNYQQNDVITITIRGRNLITIDK